MATLALCYTQNFSIANSAHLHNIEQHLKCDKRFQVQLHYSSEYMLHLRMQNSVLAVLMKVLILMHRQRKLYRNYFAIINFIIETGIKHFPCTA